VSPIDQLFFTHAKTDLGRGICGKLSQRQKTEAALSARQMASQRADGHPSAVPARIDPTEPGCDFDAVHATPGRSNEANQRQFSLRGGERLPVGDFLFEVFDDRFKQAFGLFCRWRILHSPRSRFGKGGV
jgi:hypothetical protein